MHLKLRSLLPSYGELSCSKKILEGILFSQIGQSGPIYPAQKSYPPSQCVCLAKHGFVTSVSNSNHSCLYVWKRKRKRYNPMGIHEFNVSCFMLQTYFLSAIITTLGNRNIWVLCSSDFEVFDKACFLLHAKAQFFKIQHCFSLNCFLSLAFIFFFGVSLSCIRKVRSLWVKNHRRVPTNSKRLLHIHGWILFTLPPFFSFSINGSLDESFLEVGSSSY